MNPLFMEADLIEWSNLTMLQAHYSVRRMRECNAFGAVSRRREIFEARYPEN